MLTFNNKIPEPAHRVYSNDSYLVFVIRIYLPKMVKEGIENA